jgi:hypothetical protein
VKEGAGVPVCRIVDTVNEKDALSTDEEKQRNSVEFEEPNNLHE